MTPFFWFRWFRRFVGVVLLVAVLGTLYVAGRVWWVARQDDRPRSDAIVVLGASQFDGRPSPVFRARLDHAKTLYDDSVAGRIITVGGSQPGDRFTEGAAGRRYLVDAGVPRSDVVAIKEGDDTLSSLKAVSAVLQRRGWNSAVVVTDPWHSLRARTVAGDLGIDAETSPARSGPAVRTRATELRYIARETMAYVFYKLFGRSSEWGPDAV